MEVREPSGDGPLAHEVHEAAYGAISIESRGGALQHLRTFESEHFFGEPEVAVDRQSVEEREPCRVKTPYPVIIETLVVPSRYDTRDVPERVVELRSVLVIQKLTVDYFDGKRRKERGWVFFPSETVTRECLAVVCQNNPPYGAVKFICGLEYRNQHHDCILALSITPSIF